MITNPLSKPNIAEIKRNIAELSHCAIMIEYAKRAGRDVTEQERRCEHSSKALSQLLDVYGPNFGQVH